MHIYHHRDFSSGHGLARLKRERGMTVSVVLPARNEASTVGTIVEAIQRDVVTETGLVDEVLVMDGDSEDGTGRVAARAGARVWNVRDVVPETLALPGKGTSMWKSLFVARGDIIVFLDADIVGFESHFVRGVVGPLLTDPQTRWVKAFYRRPFVMDEVEMEGYGGRVTELVVRPLLSAWYPELARVRQPLAGECAFRREDLRQMPFTSGYGVDIFLLLQMYRRYGLSGLAQVDLDVRRHRNRPVSELSLMSFSILRVFFEFLREDKGLGDQYRPAADLIRVKGDDVERVDARESILPPVASLVTGSLG